MWKNVLSAAAVMICIAGPAIAAESSRLSVPTNLQQANSEVSVPSGTAALRPARIAVAEGDASTASAANSTKTPPSAAPQRPRRVKTASPKPVVVGRQAEKEASSSRRTAASNASTKSEASPDKRIKFHPVEVKPLPGDPRRVASSAKPAPAGEVQYPVLAAESLANESTAEYEEDYAPIVTAEPQENFAPIVSAADLPRPGRVRPTVASEVYTPPDLSLPPIQPKATVPEARQDKKQPRTLSSVLRLPEFRARPSKRTDE